MTRIILNLIVYNEVQAFNFLLLFRIVIELCSTICNIKLWEYWKEIAKSGKGNDKFMASYDVQINFSIMLHFAYNKSIHCIGKFTYKISSFPEIARRRPSLGWPQRWNRYTSCFSYHNRRGIRQLPLQVPSMPRNIICQSHKRVVALQSAGCPSQYSHMLCRAKYDERIYRGGSTKMHSVDSFLLAWRKAGKLIL